MKIVSVSEMKEIEKLADSHGVSYDRMMSNAGKGVARIVNEKFHSNYQKTVAGLVGSGNNGGDTLVALTELMRSGWQAEAFILRERNKKDKLLLDFEKNKGITHIVEDESQIDEMLSTLNTFLVVIDGILGTGVKLPLKKNLSELLMRIKMSLRSSHIVSVDCPSGVDCDSGEAPEETIPAEVTVCMAAVKSGLLKFPAFEYAGEIITIDIGITDTIESYKNNYAEVITDDLVKTLMPKRAMNSHKGSFGTVIITAGSINYPGAALLSGRACYRIGAGLVRMAVPGGIYASIAGSFAEATWLVLPHEMGVISEKASDVLMNNLDKTTVMVLGPGWGLEDPTLEFLKNLLKSNDNSPKRHAIGFIHKEETPHKEDGIQKLPPLVIDADGLKLLAKIPDWPKSLPANSVLTPHPGEMAVLTGLTIAEIQNDRERIAIEFAQKWSVVVVLKGAITVIASPDGNRRIVPVATSALSKAGSGDVLSGVISGLMAQGCGSFDAASAGAWIHAQVGLLAAKKFGHDYSALAGDLIELTPEIIKSLVS